MTTQLLIPEFKVGQPSNEVDVYTFPYGYRAPCLVPGDYGGADPTLQFPEGWHTVAGDGLDEPEMRTFRYHQDAKVFEPWRVKVGRMRDELDFPIHPTQPEQPLLRLLNGGPTPYSARVSRFFDGGQKVLWQPGIEAVISQWFWMDFEYAPRFYYNLEGRGELVFNRDSDVMKNRGIVRELLSLEIVNGAFRVRWWNQPYMDAAEHWRGKQLATIPFDFRPHTWYKARMLFRPSDEQWHWGTEVFIRSQDRKQKVRFTTPSPIDTGSYLDMVFFGDERGRDYAGGKVFVTAPNVWTRALGDAAPDGED